ncbi:MAG: NADH-quinone oxidoreductase subunit C [Candidatus Bathyarchaeota archaeon]|nr:NADH-quinone oxidoreductase subunit C [Candidatus Bathyarchaeota archaeon]
MNQEKEIIEKLSSELGENFLAESKMRPNRPVVLVKKDAILNTIKILVEEFGARLCTISAVDHGLDFELIYHMSIKGIIINVKISVPKEESEVISVTSVMPGSLSVEREIWDLFQIKFQGITDSRALIVPYEWRDEKAPLRKPMDGLVAHYQKPTVENLMEQGQVFTLPSTVKSNREKLKLPEIQTTMTKPEAMNEIHEIAREVAFDKRVGYNWEKKKLRY